MIQKIWNKNVRFNTNNDDAIQAWDIVLYRCGNLLYRALWTGSTDRTGEKERASIYIN